MPVNSFNEAFFQAPINPVDPVQLQETLSTLYAKQDPHYFSTASDELAAALNAFKQSDAFHPFKFQYMKLITALNQWSIDHDLIKHIPQNQEEAAKQRAYEAAFQQILKPVNEWCSTQTLAPIFVPPTLSGLKTHLILLFSEQDHYSIRASIIFDEGKKSLEILYMLLQNPDIPLDKKKDVMSNLLLAIVACADGALTHILEAKDELLSILNSQTLFEQTKRTVIRQIAIGFHKQTHAAQSSRAVIMNQVRRELELGPDIRFMLPPAAEALLREEENTIAAHEVHYGSHYMDTVAPTYGIAQRKDDFKENIAPETIQYFPVYLNTQITPELMIECLFSQFELLYQALHHKMIALFENQPFVDYPTFQKNIASKIQTQIESWNKKYGFLCPLDLYAFVTINEENQVRPASYDPTKVKAKITLEFEQNYLTEDAKSKVYTFKFTQDESDEFDDEDTVEYHHGVVWMVKQGDTVRLTPEAFVRLQIPEFNTPQFLCYWSILNTMLLNFPNHHAELLSAFVGSPQHQAAIHHLTKRPYLIDRLIQQKQFDLLTFFQLQGFLPQDYNIRPSHPVEKDAIELSSIFRKHRLDAKETSKHIPQAFRIVCDRGTLDELKFLLRVAPYVLDQQGDQSLKTALHRAIEKKQFNHILYLVNAGARIDIPDNTGTTAQTLFQAIASETKNIKLKMYFEIPPKDEAEKALWALLDKYRLETPDELEKVLRRAALEGNVEDVSAALQLDPTLLNKQELNSKKRTALHIALESNKPEVFERLVMAGAATNVQNGSHETVHSLTQKNPTLTALLQQGQVKRDVLTALKKYIQSIDSHKPNYEFGFSFQAKSRGLNRQVNYNVAKELHDNITNTKTVNEMSHLFSPTYVTFLRRRIIHDLSLSTHPDYVERPINSKSLNAVLQLGQQTFPKLNGDCFDLKKAQLKAKLDAYIYRVAPDPSAGFLFFSALRSGSRKVNLALARALSLKLDQMNTESEVAALFTEGNIKITRATTTHGVSRFSDSINSSELNEAFKFAHEMFPVRPANAYPALIK